MDIHNQNINLMYLNHFVQNSNQQQFQNVNPNQFMIYNNNQFNMMHNMNPINNMNLNKQNLMLQNMNLINNMNLNQQNFMFQNMNLINNMNLNQQNLIAQQLINQMNFNNNNNDINIHINQVNLMNSIISFYKKNNNDNMNYNMPNQIKNILNLINPNFSGLKYNDINKIEDPLYYIKAPKKIIKFINSDYLIYNVRIPKTITKFDLYTIAKLYKNNQRSNSDVLLIYQNKVLAQDESSIETISDGDEIRIIEPRNYPDDSYYNFLSQKLGKKLNIIFQLPSGQKSIFILPETTLVSDMIKALKLKLGLENNYSSLIYNSDNFGDKYDWKIKNVLKNGDKILVIINDNPPYIIGKSVEIYISYTKKNIEHWNFEIGLLNFIKFIIEKVEVFYRAKIKKLFIGDKIFKRDDERCLSEIGIYDNFNCLIEFEEIF